MLNTSYLTIKLDKLSVNKHHNQNFKVISIQTVTSTNKEDVESQSAQRLWAQ